MRAIRYTNRFQRDYKREKSGQLGKKLDVVLMEAVNMLAADNGFVILGSFSHNAWFKKARSGQEVERCGYRCLTIIFSSRLKPSGIVPGFFMIGFRTDRCEAAFLFCEAPTLICSAEIKIDALA